MRLALLGDEDDARGFRLAGVDAMVCRTRDDVDRAVNELAAGNQASVVLVSDTVYRLTPTAIDELQAGASWPLVLVLPGRGPT